VLRMTLKLYFHPLSSFCQKVLIALYENDTPFEPQIVDLGNETSRAEFLKVWPVGKFPVLRDDAKDRTVPESSIIIEYLAQHYPGRTQLVPADPEAARETRLRDRF
jgi:glutathione S-transferase